MTRPGATPPGLFYKDIMEADYEYILKNNIKLIDNRILKLIKSKGIDKLVYKKVTRQIEDTDKKEVFIIFLAADGSNGKPVTLTKFKKRFLKFRSPNILRPYIGKTVRVYHDMITDYEGELFRIEAVDFSFDDERFNVKYSNPYITKTGIFVIPKLYISKYMDERWLFYRISFDEHNTYRIKDGVLDCYVTEESRPLSYRFNEFGKGIKTKPIPELIDIVKSTGRELIEFDYYKTIHMDSPAHKYGTIIFVARKEL